MKKKPGYCLTWLLVFSLLVGCTKKSDTHQAKSLAQEEILRLNFSYGDLPSLHPHELSMTGRGRAMGKWLFEGLSRRNQAGEYELTGAEEVTISSCQTRYIFKLRTLCYSDGSSVSAFDYENAWKEAIAPNSKCAKADLFYCIKNAKHAREGKVALDQVGVKAINEKTLFVELEHPTPYFLSLVSSCLFSPYKFSNDTLLFTGPYIVNEWKKDVSLKLTKNPFFKDQVAIKRIEITMIKEPRTALYLYEKGEFDWIGDPFSPIVEEDLETIQHSVAEQEVIRPFWIYLNTDFYPLSSPLMRRALSYAIDRELIAKYIYFGCRPLTTILPKQLSSCKASSHIDPTQAKELFEQALQELGLSRNTFPPLVLSCFSSNQSRKLAEYLKESWENVFGITITLDVQEWNTFYQNLQNRTYQVGGCFTSIDYEDPMALLTRLAPNKMNFSNWNHPEYQDMMTKIRKEANQTSRESLVKQVELLLEQEMPVISIFNQTLTYSCPNLEGLVFDYSGAPDLRWVRKKPAESCCK
ncbi:MAG: peptide ABC transporter substrate-binding protein [Chlamydiota bacterium]